MKNLVLIHGGDFAGSCWNAMLPFLKHPALAVDLPGRGRHPGDLAAMSSRLWANSVIADMDAAGIAQAVMVGHSMGGITLSALTAHYPERVAALAFVACPFPTEGHCCAESCTAEIYAALKGAWDAGIRVLDAPGRDYAAQLFGNDMDDVTMARMCADTVPESLTVFMEPLTLTGLQRGIPTLYVKLLQDRASPPAIQDQAIAAIGPDQVVTMDCGHMAMYTQPQRLAAILDEWVEAA